MLDQVMVHEGLGGKRDEGEFHETATWAVDCVRFVSRKCKPYPVVPDTHREG